MYKHLENFHTRARESEPTTTQRLRYINEIRMMTRGERDESESEKGGEYEIEWVHLLPAIYWFGMKGSMRIYCTRQQARHVWGGGENEWNNWRNLNSAFVCDVIKAEPFDKVKINFHTLAVCRPSLAISWSRLSKIYMFKHCSRDSRKRERELNISKANDSTTNHSKEKCQDQADPFQFTHKTFSEWRQHTKTQKRKTARLAPFTRS